jgi:glycosyltransferase involved in cell wall biosynthesis
MYSHSDLANAHVCFVSPTAFNVFFSQGTGGAEVQQLLLARALQSHGVKVSFVVNGHGQMGRDRIDGIDVIRCNFRYLGGSKGWFPGDTASLVRTLVRLRPDILFLKTPTTLMFPLVAAKRLTGARVVKVMARDEECVRSGALLGPVSRSRALMLRLLYENPLKRADAVVFQTEDQRALASRNFGIDGSVIRNLVGRLETGPAAVRDIDALWVGSCWAWKRAEIFLELAKSLPHLRFGMIAAPGDQGECERSIRETAATIPNLTYFGFVTYREVSKYYARAKVLVHTSDIEGFPNVFLQAWQAGVPVVSRVIDPDRVIATKRLGLVTGTPEKLREGLLALLDNDTLREELGRRGKAYVEANHSEGVVFGLYLKLFSRVLHGKEASGDLYEQALPACQGDEAR